MRKEELILENASLRGLLLELRALIDDALEAGEDDGDDADEDAEGGDEGSEEELDDSED